MARQFCRPRGRATMELVTLAATVIGILTPYVTKGAEEFVKAAGKDAYEKTKQLFATLQAKWSGNQEASEALDHFNDKPERYKTVLESILQEELEKDNTLAAEISQRLDGIGPQLHIIQRMREAKDVTGAE